MTKDKHLKTAVRALAQREDISYTAALRRLTGCTEDPPDTRSQTRGEAIYVRLLEQMDTADAAVRSADPYTRAAGHDSRALLYGQLGEFGRGDGLMESACQRASAEEKRAAARTRFAHGLPTPFPRTEIHLVGLDTCAACGRAWQADPDGACPSCPRLRFGPTPSSRAEAARLPEPEPIGAEELRAPDDID